MTAAPPTYPKINGIFKRHASGPLRGQFQFGEFAVPEFDTLWNAPWRWTEKIDGTNIRILCNHNLRASTVHARIFGRTDNAQIPPKLLAALIDLVLARLDRIDAQFNYDDGATFTLFGEGYGAGIQKGGGNYRPDNGFILFDVACTVAGSTLWLERSSVEAIAAALDLEIVQEVAVGTPLEALKLLAPPGLMVRGFESAFPGVRPEGLVGVPVSGLLDRRGNRIAMKLKCKDFDGEVGEKFLARVVGLDAAYARAVGAKPWPAT